MHLCQHSLIRGGMLLPVPGYLDRLISDTRSHGCTDLQSLVKCLDRRGIVLVLNTVCSQARVVLGCAMH